MAAIFWVASIGLATILTWMLSPIISFFLNKFLAYIYDASKELIDLRSGTMETLTLTQRGVQEQRMQIELAARGAERPRVGQIVTTLDELKDALYNAEDIYDLIDYYQLERKAGESDDTSWLQWCCLRLYVSIRESSSQMVQLVKQISAMLWHMAREISAPLLHHVQQWQWLSDAYEYSALLLQWLEGLWLRFYGIIRGRTLGEHDEQCEHLLPVTGLSTDSSWIERVSCWFRSIEFRNSWAFIVKKYKEAQLIRGRYCNQYFLESYRQTVNEELNSPIMVPLYKVLKENMKKIEKLMNSAQESVSHRNLVREISEQAYTSRSSTSQEAVEDTRTTPLLTEQVFGRDKDCRMIKELLRTTEGDSCFSVIGIVGIPGSGKTTLAQYVCQYEEAAKYFELVMWVHVSQSFQVDIIYKEMYAHASEDYTGNFNFATLEQDLRKKLSKKLSLVILDDIWYSQEVCDQKLPRLISVLVDGVRGSKILVTSRHKDILSKLRPDVRHTTMQISDLDDQSFFNLFMHHAVGSKTIPGNDEERVHGMAREIAKRLKKSPLLASVVGATIRAKSGPEVLVSHWTRVLNQELLDENMGTLWWCYQHLDEQIKQCFTFCSIFPRRYRLYQDELVNLWVAQGFINTTRDGQEMENVGQDYFDKLVSTCFLKAGGKDPSGNDFYRIHDLLHDIAATIAGSDCCNIGRGAAKKIPPNVRHLCIESCDAAMLKKDVFILEKLRTLIIYEGAEDITEEVLEEMFTKLNKLRVLIFQTERKIVHDLDILSFPESIGRLRHLRYLGFLILGVPTVLPGGLAKLYFMEVLDLGYTGYFDLSSVIDMKNFTNLRHLMCAHALDCPNIGTLTALQTIPIFDLDSEGRKLQHLKDLNRLQGELCILGLDFVETREEALEAKLADKEGLTKLTLEWNDYANPDVQGEVLEGLCPPIYVKHLRISNYLCLSYPSWMHMVGTEGSRTLDVLELYLCTKPTPQLPFISVTCLVLKFCKWDTLPYSMDNLRKLVLEMCFGLPANIDDLTSLTDLIIMFDVYDDNHDIGILPALPRSLEYIELHGTNEMQVAMSNWNSIGFIEHKNLHRWFIYDEGSVDPATSLTGDTINPNYECGWDVRRRQNDRRYHGPE